MDSQPCLWWLLIFSITQLVQESQLLEAHKLSFKPHLKGPLTNVTKHLHFPNFHPTSTLGTQNHELKFLGNARVSEDKGIIQIPQPSSQADQTAYQVGRAIYSSPIRLFDPLTFTPASFQTTFSFQFTTTNSTTTRGGNGLAFIIAPDEFTIGRPGPWLGILNDACGHYKVFAVEFDTNHNPEFGDPNDDHIGINLGAAVSFKTADLSEAEISLHNNQVHRAWITYDGNQKHIKIHLGLDGNPIPSQPILSSPLNLSPLLQEYMFIGFSASTGNSSQSSIHNILSWNFSSVSQASLHVPSTKICHRNVVHQVSKYSTAPHTNPPSSFLIFVALLILSSLGSLSFFFSGKTTNTSQALFFLEGKQRPMLPTPRRFTIPELYNATQSFSKTQVLASDGEGVLYKGSLVNGCQISVKRFSTQFLNSTRVLKRLCDRITELTHPSLPNIRGWCYDGGEAMIVYDYYQNGSLDTWLFGIGALPWTWRLKLIKEIAEGLSFLHSKQLAHGNLKASSVFLDRNYRAVVGDYGLGFVLGRAGRVESDVFGFGKLVLEIVAGRKEQIGNAEVGILGFAREMYGKGEMVKVVDERMGDRVNSEEAVRVLKIGLSCTASEIGKRPCMEEVVNCLNMQQLAIPMLS